MNNGKKNYFYVSFIFPLFSLKCQGVGGLQAIRGCGITGMFTTGRGGCTRRSRWFPSLQRQGGVSDAAFQRRGEELGRLEKATTRRVSDL